MPDEKAAIAVNNSIIQVPWINELSNKSKAWRLKVFLSLHPYQARNGKMTGGTGSQKLSDIILRKKSTVSEVNVRKSKSSWSNVLVQKLPEANFGQKYPEANVSDCLYKLLFSWFKCCNSSRDVCRSSMVAAQILYLLVVGPPPSSWSILNQLRTYVIR